MFLSVDSKTLNVPRSEGLKVLALRNGKYCRIEMG